VGWTRPQAVSDSVAQTINSTTGNCSRPEVGLWEVIAITLGPRANLKLLDSDSQFLLADKTSTDKIQER